MVTHNEQVAQTPRQERGGAASLGRRACHFSKYPIEKGRIFLQRNVGRRAQLVPITANL